MIGISPFNATDPCTRECLEVGARPLRPFLAGKIYTQATHGDCYSSVCETDDQALTANRLYAWRFMSECVAAFDQIGTWLKTGVDGSHVRLGVYDSGDDGMPITLLAESEEMATGTAQNNTAISSSIALSLRRGVSWLSMISDAAIKPRAYFGYNGGGIQPIYYAAYNSQTLTSSGLIATQTYGALPATFPSYAAFDSISWRIGIRKA